MSEKAFTHRSADAAAARPDASVWPVMLTPFSEDGDVDLDVLDRYTDTLISWGAGGLFPVALSGEMYQLSEPERLVVAARVVDRAQGRVPVVAAVSGEGRAEDIAAAAERISATGVDAVVLIASRLVVESADEAELRRVIEVVITANPDAVFGIYECPLPYHRLLSTETVEWIARTGRFSFFKETSHDVERMAERVRVAEGTPLRVLNAGIENLVESLEVGVSGLSGWIANVYPDLVARVIELAAAGDRDGALALQAELVRVEQGMGSTYPPSAKHLVEQRAAIGLRTESRWRPATVDAASLDSLVAGLPASVVSLSAEPERR